MRKIAIPIILLIILLSVSLNAQNPSAREIIEKVDNNMSALSRVFTSKMIIHNPRNTRTVESRSWSMGENKSFTEYLSPPREQGTKMLKLDNLLWIFSPSTDRIILSVDGEKIHRRLSSLSILVPCSRGGERYSVKDLFSPILHDLDSTVLVFLGLCIIILEVNTLDKACLLYTS